MKIKYVVLKRTLISYARPCNDYSSRYGDFSEDSIEVYEIRYGKGYDTEEDALACIVKEIGMEPTSSYTITKEYSNV